MEVSGSIQIDTSFEQLVIVMRPRCDLRLQWETNLRLAYGRSSTEPTDANPSPLVRSLQAICKDPCANGSSRSACLKRHHGVLRPCPATWE